MTENIESNKELAQVQLNSTYTLPAWRLNEIAATAIKMLCDAEYYADGFDYKKNDYRQRDCNKGIFRICSRKS